MNERIAQQNQLICLNDGVLDLASMTLEYQVHQLDREIEKANDQLAVESDLAGKIAHKLAFEFPEFAEQVRVLANRLAYLMRMPQVGADTDPISGRGRDGEIDKSIKEANQRKEAEDEEYVRKALETAEGKMLARECKRVYRQIRALCHPDRTADKSLHPVFDFATKRYRMWDLKALQNVLGQVKNYKKLRTNNKDFQAYLTKLIATKKRDAENARANAEAYRKTPEYEAMVNGQSEIKAVRRAAYAKLVKVQIDALKAKLAELENKRSHNVTLSEFFKR